MSALVDSTRPTCLTSSRPSESYVTTGRAGLYAGLSRNSIKALLKSGELVGRKTRGGHWRIKTSSLVCWVEGVEEEEIEGGQDGGVVVYIRVSSAKQQADGSLDRQRERLTSEVASREGISREEVVVFSECASSFGRRPKLYSLVDGILAGTIKKIYVEYLDRWSRTSSERCLLEHLASQRGCEIIPLDLETTDPADIAYLTQELIAYITVVTNRVSAAKSRIVTFKELSDETIRTLFCWMGEGLGLTAIFQRAKKEGLRTEAKGPSSTNSNDKPGEPLSYYKIRDLLHNGKGKLVGTVVGMDSTSPTQILSDWLGENVVEDDTKGTKVFTEDIREEYKRYCVGIGIEALPINNVGQAMTTLFPGRGYKTSKTGRTGLKAYRGLALKES